MEISSYRSKHWNSGPILMHIGFLICSFKTLGFWLFLHKHWNYDLMPAKIGFLALFYKHWRSVPIGILTSSFQMLEFSIIVILALFFQTLEFLSHSFTANIEILATYFETIWILVLFLWQYPCYPSKHWNCGLIFIHIGCVILFFKTLRFWPHFCKHRKYDLIVAKVEIVALFYTHYNSYLLSKILVFWPYFYNHRNSDLIFLNIWNTGIRILSF